IKAAKARRNVRLPWAKTAIPHSPTSCPKPNFSQSNPTFCHESTWIRLDSLGFTRIHRMKFSDLCHTATKFSNLLSHTTARSAHFLHPSAFILFKLSKNAPHQLVGAGVRLRRRKARPI